MGCRELHPPLVHPTHLPTGSFPHDIAPVALFRLIRDKERPLERLKEKGRQNGRDIERWGEKEMGRERNGER